MTCIYLVLFFGMIDDIMVRFILYMTALCMNFTLVRRNIVDSKQWMMISAAHRLMAVIHDCELFSRLNKLKSGARFTRA